MFGTRDEELAPVFDILLLNFWALQDTVFIVQSSYLTIRKYFEANSKRFSGN